MPIGVIKGGGAPGQGTPTVGAVGADVTEQRKTIYRLVQAYGEACAPQDSEVLGRVQRALRRLASALYFIRRHIRLACREGSRSGAGPGKLIGCISIQG
jgi:hypothetical protein